MTVASLAVLHRFCCRVSPPASATTALAGFSHNLLLSYKRSGAVPMR